jgi:hypothetical protein
MWALVILLLLAILFMVVKKPVSSTGVSGTGPGYIAPFQGYPGSGVSGV